MRWMAFCVLFLFIGCTPYWSIRNERVERWMNHPPKGARAFLNDARQLNKLNDWNDLNGKTIFIPLSDSWNQFVKEDPYGLNHPDEIVLRRNWLDQFVCKDTLGPGSLRSLDSIPCLRGYLKIDTSNDDILIENGRVERIIRFQDGMVYLFHFHAEQFR